MRPMRLRNTEGRWRVIVNKIGLYDQTVRVETCLNNGSNCRLLPPCFNTQVLDRVVRIQFVKKYYLTIILRIDIEIETFRGDK